MIEKFEQLIAWLDACEDNYVAAETSASERDECWESGWCEGYNGGAKNMCSHVKRWIRDNVPGVTIESSDNTATLHPSDLPSSERTASGSDSEAG